MVDESNNTTDGYAPAILQIELVTEKSFQYVGLWCTRLWKWKRSVAKHRTVPRPAYSGTILSGKGLADQSSYQPWKCWRSLPRYSFQEQPSKFKAVSRLSSTALWGCQILVQKLSDKCRTMTNCMGRQYIYVWGETGVCSPRIAVKVPPRCRPLMPILLFADQCKSSLYGNVSADQWLILQAHDTQW